MARRVYFAFDYQDVVDFRANVVRNHSLLFGAQTAGYWDHSIWEEALRTNPTALKRLINRELEGSSTTVVLIGSDTWTRRWVRYEIMKSLERRNRLIGVHINSIRCKRGLQKPQGTNPFLTLGLRVGADGTGRPVEWRAGTWQQYDDLVFGIPSFGQVNARKLFALSTWFTTYDWVADSGITNFRNWIA